jgi:hypothetical protein
MEPEVRHLIVCDHVHINPHNLHRFDVFGLMTTLRSRSFPPFPMIRPLLCILVVLTAGDAAGETGDLWVRIVKENTNRLIFRSSPRLIRFVSDPEDTSGAMFRAQNCSFPSAGLYWVECLFSGTVLARQRLFVRS